MTKLSEPTVDKPYRWEYRSMGSCVLCFDESNSDGIPVAMCACKVTAEIICEALNKTRKPEQRL